MITYKKEDLEGLRSEIETCIYWALGDDFNKLCMSLSQREHIIYYKTTRPILLESYKDALNKIADFCNTKDLKFSCLFDHESDMVLLQINPAWYNGITGSSDDQE